MIARVAVANLNARGSDRTDTVIGSETCASLVFLQVGEDRLHGGKYNKEKWQVIKPDREEDGSHEGVELPHHEVHTAKSVHSPQSIIFDKDVDGSLLPYISLAAYAWLFSFVVVFLGLLSLHVVEALPGWNIHAFLKGDVEP